MDMLGRVVYHTRGSVHDQFSFGKNFAAGMYVAEVLNGKNTQTIKLIRAN